MLFLYMTQVFTKFMIKIKKDNVDTHEFSCSMENLSKYIMNKKVN